MSAGVKERFRGCPPICEETNLPSFASEAAAVDWHGAPGRGNPLYAPNMIKRLWQCRECGQWHFLTKIGDY